MSPQAVTARKRASHWLKQAWYRCTQLDGTVDTALHGGAPVGWRRLARERWLYHLFPERRMRDSPFEAAAGPPSGRARILTLVPPEDTGGGSRPAQLAAELHRRGFAIEWRWALPIFPWPRTSRPAIDRVDARHVDDPAGPPTEADLVLLEAPHPRLFDLARSGTRSGSLVYEAIDVWDGSLGAGWYDRDVEERIHGEADVLTASAGLLRDELAARSERPVHLLPNAVDLARFVPRGLAAPLARGRPTVIYVGALWGEWVDLRLIERLARAHPEAQIHLVGPVGDRSLASSANLHVHGPKPRSEIPDLLASADVGIVPFAPSRLSTAVSPLKVFEYLAMGRPVVSTPLPELRGVPGVTVADDADAFVEAVARVPSEPFPHDAVRAFLEGQTWTRRVDQLFELTRPARG